MRKAALVLTISAGILCFGCSGNTANKEGHATDSVAANRPQIDTSIKGNGNIDSPALGTDNIRMDSMNNNNR